MLPVDDQGSGEPVLLLHAGVADRTMWREHLGWLAEAGFRAVAVDLPGFGEAPTPSGLQAPWEDVLQTLRDLGLDLDQAVVVGNSFGAAVALRVAVIAPAAVSKLVLISPPPLGVEPSPTLAAAWEAEEDALERGDLEGAVSAVVDAWLLPDAPDGVREQVAAMQRRAFTLQESAAGIQEAPDPLEQQPDLVAQLPMPVLAAAGESDMPDFIAAAEGIARAVPLGQLRMIEGAGHLAPLEAPDRFREIVLEFLGAHG